MMDEINKKGQFYDALYLDEFKKQSLDLIAEVAERGGSVVIFDGDEPVAEVVRYVERPSPAYGSLKGKVQILGDIEGPMPVEWYTHPDVQTDDDWDISGPMPASWFVNPNEGKPLEPRKPDKVDVSILRRHKVLTLDIDELATHFEEIIAIVSETEGRKVIVFDDEKALVQLTKFEERLRLPGDAVVRPPGEESPGTLRNHFDTA